MLLVKGGGSMGQFPIVIFYVLFHVGWAISIMYSALFGLGTFAAPDYEVQPLNAYILWMSAGTNAAAWISSAVILGMRNYSQASPIPSIRFTAPLAVALTSLVVNNYIYWSVNLAI